MNNTFKRYLISTGVTFIASFSFVFFGMISSSSFHFTKDAIIAIFFSAVFAGVRAVAKVIYELAAKRLNK